jgi:hypothetical protein
MSWRPSTIPASSGSDPPRPQHPDPRVQSRLRGPPGRANLVGSLPDRKPSGLLALDRNPRIPTAYHPPSDRRQPAPRFRSLLDCIFLACQAAGVAAAPRRPSWRDPVQTPAHCWHRRQPHDRRSSRCPGNRAPSRAPHDGLRLLSFFGSLVAEPSREAVALRSCRQGSPFLPLTLEPLHGGRDSRGTPSGGGAGAAGRGEQGHCRQVRDLGTAKLAAIEEHFRDLETTRDSRRRGRRPRIPTRPDRRPSDGGPAPRPCSVAEMGRTPARACHSPLTFFPYQANPLPDAEVLVRKDVER